MDPIIAVSYKAIYNKNIFHLELSLPKIINYEQSLMETRNDDLSVTCSDGQLRIYSWGI